MHPDNRPSWTSLATMSPASSPRRTGSRSRKPTCTSKTRSSGDPLLLWLSRSPEKTNLNRSRCGSSDRDCPQDTQDGRVWDGGEQRSRYACARVTFKAAGDFIHGSELALTVLGGQIL